MILDRLEPAGPIIAPPIERIDKHMDWQERLRTTEEILQRLSTGYPFTWHGDD